MIIGIDARPLISDKPSGIGVYLSEVLNVFKNSSNDNNFILYSNKPISSKYSFPNNFQIKVIPGKIGTLWLRYIIPRSLVLDDVDVFWGTQHILPKRNNKIKYILTVHDLSLIINPSWGSIKNAIMQNLFTKASIRDADILIADSKSTKKDIERLCKVQSNKIKTIYLGGVERYLNFDDKLVKATLEKYNITNKFFYYVGTIEPRKNIGTIVKAFERVCNFYPNIQLVLSGGLGWKYKPILELIEKSTVSKNIVRTGYISTVEKAILLNNAQAFVFPSHYEGFGIPVLEAMTQGTLVITARNSSLCEVGGDAAFYMENESDSDELEKLMETILSMPKEARIFRIEHGLQIAKAFSWDVCARKTMDILINGGK